MLEQVKNVPWSSFIPFQIIICKVDKGTQKNSGPRQPPHLSSLACFSTKKAKAKKDAATFRIASHLTFYAVHTRSSHSIEKVTEKIWYHNYS